MVLKMGRWFHNTNLNKNGSHIVAPKKKITEAGRINLRDGGEIQNDVVPDRFFCRHNLVLDVRHSPAIKLPGEGEGFRLAMASFFNLLHTTYLRIMKMV